MIKTLFFLFFATELFAQNEVILSPFPLKEQSRSNWCWNASDQGVLAHFGIYKSQYQVWRLENELYTNYYPENWTGGTVKYFGDPFNVKPGDGWYNPAAYYTGIGSNIFYSSGGPYGYGELPSFEQIKGALDKGHPVGAVIDWVGGGAHRINIFGYASISGKQYIYSVDPWPGIGFEVREASDRIANSLGEIHELTEFFKNDIDPKHYPVTIPLIDLSSVDKDFAIYGFDQVTINDRVECSNCLIGSGWLDKGGFTQTSYGVSIGSNAKVKDILTTGRVWLRSGAKVSGSISTINGIADIDKQDNSVSFNKIQNDDGFENGVLPDATFGFGEFNWGSSHYPSVFLEPGVVGPTLVPRVGYYSVELKRNSTVRLITGEYFIHDLKCEDCTIYIDQTDGPVTLYIMGSILLRATPRLVKSDPETAYFSFNEGDASKFTLIYTGSGTVSLDRNFYGSFLAPNANLVLGQSQKDYVGMFHAKTVTVHQDSKVAYVPFE